VTAAGSPAQEATVSVVDGRTRLTFTFDDLIRYHGRESVGGLALGFKVLERGLPLLSPDGPVERREVTVATAFDGPGARDAFEMVVRAVTGERYSVVPDLAGPGAPEAPQGHFVFRLGLGDAATDLVLRPGFVGDDFVALVRKGPEGEAEEEQLVAMKEDLAARVLARPAAEVYDAAVSRSASQRASSTA